MPAEDQLQKVALQHFQRSHQAFPVRATTLGIHTYDHVLGDYSSESLAAQRASLQENLRQLNEIDAGDLSPASRVDFHLLDSDIRLALSWHTQTEEWKRNPNFYAETPLYGVFLLVVRGFAPVEERAASVAARLREVSHVLDAARANLENPPRVYTEIAIQTTEDGLEFFKNSITKFAGTIPQLEQDILRANRKAVEAYEGFLRFLKEDLLPRSNGSFSVGRAHYEERLRLEHALDVSAPDLKRTGERVFQDVERQMTGLAAALDSKKSWSQIVEEARAEHPSTDRLLEAYLAEIKRLRSYIIDNGVVTVPQNEILEVTYTPQFARSTLPYAAYFPPAPFEERQEGEFWVTPVDERSSKEEQAAQLREHCHFALPAIALHEAYPGHHVQLVRSDNVSSYIRKHISSNILCEGWAFYCEDMMSLLGYRPAYVESSRDVERGEKLFRLFVLKDALWRAARVIIDVGLHTEGMSVEDAVKLLTDRVCLSKAAAIGEVKRYTLSPTQPMSYSLGRLQITALREELKAIPLRQFHDMLLSHGTIPIKYIRERILAEIGSQRGPSL